MEATSLERRPVHLGRGGAASVEPVFTGEMAWYSDYATRHADDGPDGRLVSLHSFSESWASWEMHPLGAEVVVCTAGEITLIQDRPDGSVERVTLRAGDYAINQPGVWHTADVSGRATALFITTGAGTETRPR